MQRAATETFAARNRGPKPPLPHPARSQRLGAMAALACFACYSGANAQESDTGRKEQPGGAIATSEVLEDLYKDSVPFPRAVQLSELPFGPPPPPLLAQLGSPPDWEQLAPYQHSILREEFEKLLSQVYSTEAPSWTDYIQILPDRARIIRQSNWPAAGYYDLLFRNPDDKAPAEVARYWTPPFKLRPPINNAKPLADLHILVDPGHIGGEFARTEGRWYQIGSENEPVMEGEMSLRVARILEHDLTLLGARVSLSRERNAPVTPQRPRDLQDEARDYYLRRAKTTKPLLPRSQVETLSYKFFYLNSEIRARAAIVNQQLQPDLALCLHFNAEAWGNPRRPRFKRNNHYHILLNGCYSRGEMAEDDHRLEMLQRLLQRVHYYELGMANAMSRSMARETRLPAMGYNTPNARKVGTEPGVWARDLLANRKFMCPVVFFEPYIMNNREVHDRVQEGEYPGLREFNGIFKKNIYQEYADSITTGLVNYFRAQRP